MDELVPSFESVDQLLARYPRLGIPHFQRGLVWNDAPTALLLESLYYGTPCGTVILWNPVDPNRYGEPLPGGQQFEDLIVDGQQRTRMLHQVYGGESSDGKVWCLDLTAEPTLKEYFDEGHRSDLFTLTARDVSKRNSRHQKNMIPLDQIESGDLSNCRERFNIHVRAGAEPQFQEQLKGVVTNVCHMRRRHLFGVIRLPEKASRYGIDEIVSLYNRINSAGRRVEVEEMAYASLVRLYPQTTDYLRDFLEAVHGDRGYTSRDNLLKRERESKFGFKLYLRTFVQVCNYHFARSSGSQGFSFDIIDSDELNRWFKNSDTPKDALFIRTRDVLTSIFRIVTQVLKCDDLRMLPDTECLIPAIHLLIRYYPKSRDKVHEGKLAYLILRRIMEPERNQKQTLDILKAIDKTHRLNECFISLARKDGIEWNDHKGGKLHEALKQANTLNDRYVLLFYWLLRTRQARDFSYAHIRPKDAVGSPSEQIISKEISPEKQHICPSSVLGRGIYGDTGRILTSRHLANNIGNLTYISHELNGLEGLAAQWMDPEIEAQNGDNLARHYLKDEALETYRILQRKVVLKPEDEKSYEKFCALRRALIQADLLAWLGELAVELAGRDEDAEPEHRLASPQIPDFIRMLGYPNLIEDALLGLAGMTSVFKPDMKWKKEKWTGEIPFALRERKKPSLVRLIAYSTPPRIELENRPGHPLFEKFREIMERNGIVPKPDVPRPWVISCDDQDESRTGCVLQEFAKALDSNSTVVTE